MENASLASEVEYGDYSDLLMDVPVDCADGACPSEDAPPVAPLLLFAAVFLLGVPGNAMAAWAAGREAGRRAGARWLVHLAAADLLCCLCLPVLAVPIARGRHWPYGAAGCRLLPAAVLLSMHARVLLLAALSADLGRRAVGRACGARREALAVRAAQGAVWALAALLAVPSVVHRRLHREHFPPRLECVLDFGGSVAAESAVAAVRFIFGFLGPLAVVVGCHCVLLRATRRHWPLGTAVVVGFFVCWTPYHILGLVLAAAAPNSALLARALRAEPLVVGLAVAHSCLNPLFFLYFGRAQLRRSLPAACRWALRESQDEEESVVSKMPTSHDLVSEMEV